MLEVVLRDDITIRDPFIFRTADHYIMTGTMRVPGEKLAIWGYTTKDLEHFEGPIKLFDPPEGFWGDREFWAPEIHQYGGKYYLFASFRSESRRRASQVFVADAPEGPYKEMGEGPHTPERWHCLDGTLFIENDEPYMVYVREFVQMVDGEMYAQKLKRDLSGMDGEPQKLFQATWAPWCVTNEEGGMPFDFPGGYITDGPFLFRLASGQLGMLWSSFCDEGYCQAVAYSASGTLRGPWAQEDEPLYKHNSGHGMLFETFDGEWMLTLHDNNNGPCHSKPVFLRASEAGDRLVIFKKK